MHQRLRTMTSLVALIPLALLMARAQDQEPWTVLVGTPTSLSAWESPTGDWATAGDAELKTGDEKHLQSKPEGPGAIINDPPGRTSNLISRETFGDVTVHLEFMVPKGSNSGIKLMGLYEVQIQDSYGVAKPTASDCGGIYPRATLLPRYHHIDLGYPPRVNASKPPGEWQTLDINFVAPRIDENGKKTANARFVKVVLNGQVVHENLEIPYPTGHAWTRAEVARGPILLQADHGPVAFRNVKVKPLAPSAKPPAQ